MAAVHDVREIIAWRLAHQLNLRVDLFLLSPDFRRHYQPCEGLSHAARSAPRRIAEGVDQLRHREGAQLVRMARTLEEEILTHLSAAHAQMLITDDEWMLTRQLTRRAMGAASRLIRYLEITGDPTSLPPGIRSTPPPTRASPRHWG